MIKIRNDKGRPPLYAGSQRVETSFARACADSILEGSGEEVVLESGEGVVFFDDKEPGMVIYHEGGAITFDGTRIGTYDPWKGTAVLDLDASATHIHRPGFDAAYREIVDRLNDQGFDVHYVGKGINEHSGQRG